MDYAARCEVLERELSEARERIALLEAELGADDPVPLSFRLTGNEARLFGALLRRPVLTKQMAMAAIYSGRAIDEPEPKIVDVFVCKMRAKLKPFGIVVETLWGSGWRLSAEHKAEVHVMIAAERGQAEAAPARSGHRGPASAITGSRSRRHRRRSRRRQWQLQPTQQRAGLHARAKAGALARRNLPSHPGCRGAVPYLGQRIEDRLDE